MTAWNSKSKTATLNYWLVIAPSYRKIVEKCCKTAPHNFFVYNNNTSNSTEKPSHKLLAYISRLLHSTAMEIILVSQHLFRIFSSNLELFIIDFESIPGRKSDWPYAVYSSLSGSLSIEMIVSWESKAKK